MTPAHKGGGIAKGGPRRLARLSVFLAFLNLAFMPANSVIVSSVRECRHTGDGEITDDNCEWRSHVNIDVQGGLKSYDYVLREAKNPNKGIYVHVYTAATTISYPLTYISDVPLYYREHTVPKSYGNVHGKCDECDLISHPKCSDSTAIPPYLRSEHKQKVCCSCDMNAKDGSPRADFRCLGFAATLMLGDCMSMSCLEIVGPWYSLFRPEYPAIHRRVFVDAFSFDGDKKIIPDVATKGYNIARGRAEDRLFLSQPVYKDGHFKFTLSKSQSFAKSEEMGIEFTLVKSALIDGNAPQKLEKIIAVPSWPDTDPVVQGCSRKHDCRDSTWTKDDELCEKIHGRDCRMERCAYNIRAIEPDAVDTTGVSCDKIGVTLGTWGNESRLCNSAPGSCVQNQLGWYLNEKGDDARLPHIYGSLPLVARKAVKKEEPPAAENEWLDRNFIHSIAYTINEPDSSRVEINSTESTVTLIISDVVGFIISANFKGECKISSETPCIIIVVTKNAGNRNAPYYHRARCYEESAPDVAVALSKEYLVEVKANKELETQLILELMHIDVTSPLTCEVELYSGGKKLLETVKLAMTLNAPKPTLGMDARSFDDKTNTDADKLPDNGGSIPSDGQCHCSGLAVACFFTNFSPCMHHFFNTYYTWFIVVIAVLVVLVLLPVFIPLIRYLFSRIGYSLRESKIRLQERYHRNNLNSTRNNTLI